MLQKIIQYCKQEELIKKGDCVLAGVSGGADSVCMLLLLIKLQREMEFYLEVVHIEHGIRGTESEEDAYFVKQLCEKLNIPIQIFSVQALEYAKEQKMSLEEAARVLRYDCYVKAAERVSMQSSQIRISLAHHADDNAETVLFQMLRGGGIDGLSGMKPKRELKKGIDVIRPMLLMTRKEIERFLAEEEQPYCIDSTNQDTDYSRNKIRNIIFPILEEINTQAVAHINQSALMLGEMADYLKIQVLEVAKNVFKEEKNGLLLLKERWENLPVILKKEVCHLALVKVSGSAKDIGFEHVRSFMGLMELQVGRNLDLPYGMKAKRVYEGIFLQKQKIHIPLEEKTFFRDISKEELEECLVNESALWDIPNGKIQLSLLKMTEENIEISKNRYTKFFDYDKIKDGFQIRTRQTGDYLVIDKAGHKKRLKEYFINEKIPSEKRDEILLLTHQVQVLWVIGGRISEDVKVGKDTKRIVKVQVIGGKYYEKSESDS